MSRIFAKPVLFSCKEDHICFLSLVHQIAPAHQAQISPTIVRPFVLLLLLFFGDGSQGINELPNGEDYSSISSSSSTVDDDGANVHAAAESFFANADVIETLYLGLDTDNYDEAIAAAAQDFINASDIV